HSQVILAAVTVTVLFLRLRLQTSISLLVRAERWRHQQVFSALTLSVARVCMSTRSCHMSSTRVRPSHRRRPPSATGEANSGGPEDDAQALGDSDVTTNVSAWCDRYCLDAGHRCRHQA